MSYTVKDLVDEEQVLVTISPDGEIEEALALMVANDFSQLPVVDDQGKQRGMVAYENIIEALSHLDVSLSELSISNVTQKAPAFGPEDKLTELLERLKNTNAALIVDRNKRVTGIVTVYDAMEFFRLHAEDLMLVEDIESSIKDHILAAFTDKTGEQASSALVKAIQKILPGPRKTNHPRFRQALQHYLQRTGLESAEINDEALDESLTMLFGKDKGKEFEKLTLNEYIQLLLHKSQWPHHQKNLDIGRTALQNLLEKVRKIRNDLAHFRGELPATQLKLLQYCVDLFEKYQPGPALAQPEAHEPIYSQVREQAMQYGFDTSGSEEFIPGDEELGPEESRYAPLAIMLQSISPEKNEVRLSFDSIEDILNDDLPASARRHRAWWANDPAGHPHARQWLDVGWRTYRVNMQEEELTFIRVRDRERAYMVFYSRLLSELRKQSDFPLLDRKPAGVNWHVVARLPADSPQKAVLGFAFTRSGQFRVELYIDTGDRQQNKAIFDHIHKRKDEIENELGETLSWERIDDRRASRIAIYRDTFITAGPAEREELRTWAVKMMVRFCQVLQGPVSEAISASTK